MEREASWGSRVVTTPGLSQLSPSLSGAVWGGGSFLRPQRRMLPVGGGVSRHPPPGKRFTLRGQIPCTVRSPLPLPLILEWRSRTRVQHPPARFALSAPVAQRTVLHR